MVPYRFAFKKLNANEENLMFKYDTLHCEIIARLLKKFVGHTILHIPFLILLKRTMLSDT